MLSAGISNVLASRGNSCRFLEGVGEVLMGCVPMDVVCGPDVLTRGDVVPVRTAAGAVVLSKTTFLCAA